MMRILVPIHTTYNMLSSDETLADKFVKKGFWIYFFTFLIAPLGYMTKVMISRDLSVEEVGMIYGVMSFLTLLSLYNDLGCTESLNYFLPKHIVKGEYTKAKYLLLMTVKIQLVSSIILMSILFFLIPWLTAHFFKSDVSSILSVGILYFLGVNLIHISSTIFSIAQDTKLGKSIEFIRLSGTTIGVGILFFTDFGSIRSYMIAWIIGLYIGCLYGGYYAYKKYYKPYFGDVIASRDLSLRTSFLTYSLGTLLTANIGTLLSQIDMQLIIIFLSQKDVGYYSTYLSLIGLPFMLISPIIGFLFPVISELSGRGNIGKIRTIIGEFSLYFMIIGIWTGVFFFQYGEYISILLFGEKFRESGYILQYSAPFIIFNFLTQISFQILAGTGKVKERAKILLTTLCINIPLTILFILSPLGVRGAALAVGISWIPLWYMSMKGTSEYRGDWNWAPFIKNILSALFASIILIVLEKYIVMGKVLLFFIAIGVYMSIFLLTNRSLLSAILKTIQQTRKLKTVSTLSPDSSLLP